MKEGRQSFRAKTRALISERRAKVAHSYLHQGKTQLQIARELGCGVATVSEDLSALRAEWKRVAFCEVAEHVALELHKINHLEAEARAAYERSRKPKRIVAASKTENASGTTTFSSATQEERDEGDPRFLALVSRCTDQRIVLLGLARRDSTHDAETKQPQTFSDFIAMHDEAKGQNGTGSTAKVARPTAVPLDPRRLP